ncbi:hypothetical protein [Streptomyces sp. NBC_01718]|uniref:hypothetical protein n=1 Tax=unclassified Streptomyces TaxID=2593676 RepID=UPI0030E2D0EF
MECGTRALFDVVFSPHDTPEPEPNAVLCRSLRPGMLVLADRASHGYPLMCKAVATGADLLWRIQNNRSLAVIHTLPDGSCLSMVADVCGRDRPRYWARHPRAVPPQVEGVAIRVIDATITATSADGSTGTRAETALTDVGPVDKVRLQAVGFLTPLGLPAASTSMCVKQPKAVTSLSCSQIY